METDIDKKIAASQKTEKHYVEHKEHETHQPEKSAVEETAPPSSRKIWLIVSGIVMIFAIVAIGYYYWTTMETTTQVIIKETQQKEEVVKPVIEEKIEPKEVAVEEKSAKPVEEVKEIPEEKVVAAKNETPLQGEVSLAEYVLKEDEKELRAGNFIKARSSFVMTLGRARLIKKADSSYKIVFDKFITGKPKKANHVYLMEKEPLNAQDIVYHGIDLGELKSLEGVQEYPIKNGNDIELKRVVTLYDPTYQIITANALLNPK